MIPVILSGGSGTRLWPVSRASFPKQFNDLVGESLLARTLKRVSPLGPPWVVAAAGGEVLTRRVTDELGLPRERAVFEPVGRNTAPAVALACHLFLLRGWGEEVMGAFPSDHLIADEEGFRRAARLGERCARDGHVVTLGIRPTHPATGYGYVELTEEVAAEDPGGDGAAPLAARFAAGFREKPDAATAARFVESGRFLWNPGMFFFRIGAMAALFERLMPELWAAIRRVSPDLANLAEVYADLPSESLDYGIMEKLDRHLSIPCDIGWSDVGSWDEVARFRDSAAAVFERQADGNFVYPLRDRVYGLVGVEGLIVVDTDDALLIARRGSSEGVKQLVEAMKAAGRREAVEHTLELRPWGDFEVLRDTPRFKSKIIRVHPGQQLSYQSHRHRSEHWVIVAGHPEVVLDEAVHRLAPGDHIAIPQGARHRIRNPGSDPVELVEVQLGSYFGEDDIVRYEDDYDRS
ncbi:MAG TPA: mannose-1-phosphate guanylyltransferase/mannose-6-phosphate isomerase [Thermoanaerobaculia bacterium]|nr:mannose-1-phosphate guanylyltransferase/mannose-6-phosphate isomerase [Thermoanaerobaculia bacterium]